MSMSAGFPWVDKTRRKSCHRRSDSGELDVFEAERYFSTAIENPGHRSKTLSHKTNLATTTTRQNWRELGRVSLDIPMMKQNHHQNIFLDTMNPTYKDKKKNKNPSSPGGKLASFFNSLISQAVSKKKKTSKSSPQSVKELVEEESPSAWRRMRRRSSISHFRSSASSTASSFSSAFASRKPNNPTLRTKRTSMSDIETKSIESCPSISGFRTPPLYLNKSTQIKPCKNTNVSIIKHNGSSEKRSSKDFERHVYRSSSQGFSKFVEDDGGDSDSSSDLFELKINYDHRQLGYCGGGLPVYGSTHMDSIKISSGTTLTNGPFRNS